MAQAGRQQSLFNVPGTLTGRVMLVGDAAGLADGVLTLAGANHSLEARLGFGEEKRLDLVAHFDALGASGSAMVAALLPGIAVEPAFGISFPFGSFSLTGTSARVLGLDGTGLVAEGRWGSGRVNFSRLAAAEWGGVGFDATLVAGGTVAEPDISGSGLVPDQRGRRGGPAGCL